MKMSVSYRYLNTNLDLLEGFGFPREMSLSTLNLTEGILQDLNGRMSIELFLNLMNQAAKTLSDPHIALRLGHKFRVATFAETGSVYVYCKSLEDVIKMNGKYQKLAIDVGNVASVNDGPDRNFMTFTPYYEDMERYRPITDIVMGAYFTAYHWLSWGSGEEMLGVKLPYAAPDDLKTHESIFQMPLHFNAKQISLQFSDAAMRDTLISYDPERLVRIKAKLDGMIGENASIESFETLVDAAIRAAIKNGHVTSHVVADRMGVTWSAFRTALRRSGSVFRDRVDDIRQALFQNYVAEGLSFSQIAMALAYNDQAAMNRAFRRWYGMTPTQWKAAHFEEGARVSNEVAVESD
jgi:AraC-like DNA-binding protein